MHLKLKNLKQQLKTTELAGFFQVDIYFFFTFYNTYTHLTHIYSSVYQCHIWNSVFILACI